MFDGIAYAQWRAFRESEDSRYVGLCLPRVLMRLPYGPGTVTAQTFNFEEDVDGLAEQAYLWGNMAYLLGTRLTAAFAKYQWCATMCSHEGGVMDGLPTHTLTTNGGTVVHIGPL